MWIRGSAGAGKTALVQTTAERIEQTNRAQVLGCHFFSRTSANGQRSEAERWVPGLAHQMTLALPETLPLLQKTIESNSGLFEQQITTLLDQLFVRPLNNVLEPTSVAEKPAEKLRFPSWGWWRVRFASTSQAPLGK